MAMNAQKVLVSGIVAGVVLTGLDLLINGLILADQNRAAMEALNPALAASMEGASMLAVTIAIDLALGILLIWTYAAMRPRFGAGPRTAVIATVQVWLVAVLMFAFMAAAGMFTWSFYAIGVIAAFVSYVIPAVIGARFYNEA